MHSWVGKTLTQVADVFLQHQKSKIYLYFYIRSVHLHKYKNTSHPLNSTISNSPKVSMSDIHPPWIKACACIGTPRYKEYLHIKRWLPETGRHGFYLMTPRNRESWGNVSWPRWNFQRGSPFWRPPISIWQDETSRHENSRGRQIGDPSYITVNISFTVSSCYLSLTETVPELSYVLFTRPKFVRVDVLSKYIFWKFVFSIDKLKISDIINIRFNTNKMCAKRWCVRTRISLWYPTEYLIWI